MSVFEPRKPKCRGSQDAEYAVRVELRDPLQQTIFSRHAPGARLLRRVPSCSFGRRVSLGRRLHGLDEPGTIWDDLMPALS